MVFAAALGPIVARHPGDRVAVEHALSHAARWVIAIAVPVALGFALLGGDLLARLVPGERGEPIVVAVLILGPLANCAGGLASNFLVFLLHNRWNLGNAVVAGLLKTGLVLALVPRHGLIGAAAATAVTMALLTVAENVELWRLARIRIRFTSRGSR
jgi:O-antigen/teichoic acid export membrane protein